MAEEESKVIAVVTPHDSDDEEDEIDIEKLCEEDIENLDSMDTRPTDVSFHRPTNTEELLALQQAPDDIPVLFGDDGIININDLIVPDKDEVVPSSDSKLSVSMTKFVHLEKVLNLLGELISTEVDFVRDVGLLCDFLDECTYCSKTAVHSFVNSTTFIGFRVAADNIKSINTLFLKFLTDSIGSVEAIGQARNEMMEDRFSPAIEMLNGLCISFDQFSPLFTQYKHIIQLHRPITILYAALGDNKSFSLFVKDIEKTLSQNFLSLSIKPVQRLPRYILLVKEMLKCVHRSVQLFDGDDQESLLKTRLHLRESCISISNCTLLCNNAMREYEDLQKLHSLDRRFKDCQLKKKYNFVTIRKNRVHVLEGEIKRRHERIGIRSYLCHVFSDIMLISVTAGNGGLKLKNIIPLGSNCGVACVPVPNSALSTIVCTDEGCWFAMVVTNKIMFLSAKSCPERDKWVKAINSVLHRNDGDYDILYNSERMKLFNEHIDRYYKRHADTDSGIAEAERAVCVTQVNWWQILSTAADDSSTLKNTVTQQNANSINRLLKTFDKKKQGPIEQVLSVSYGITHFPICFDYFFDYPKKSSRAALSTDFQAPVMIKVYLFHDVIIAATISGNEDGRSAYYFHIDLSSLELHSEDALLSITLVDTSVTSTKGIIQSLWKHDVRERTIVASNFERKRKWMILLQEAISRFKSVSPTSVSPELCTKVQMATISTWKYQERPSINWDNLG